MEIGSFLVQYLGSRPLYLYEPWNEELIERELNRAFIVFKTQEDFSRKKVLVATLIICIVSNKKATGTNTAAGS